MFAAISPYHLTTREPPAMAALLLAERAVTFLPSPRGSREAVEQAVAESPEYLRFMETWAWSGPLWERGVVASALDDGDDALGDLHTAWKHLCEDERYAPLRPLARRMLFETEQDFLEEISRDLLRGGSDPGVSLPLDAGIDRFAARRGLVVMRSHPTSVAQKAEQHLGQRVFAVAVPILVQASAERLLETRERLADELEDLADAVGEVAEVVAQQEDVRDEPALIERVEQTARAYAHAFACERVVITAGRREELHVIERMASISAVSLPVDAVLRSGVRAMRSLADGRSRRSCDESPAVETMPVLADTLGRKRVLSLVIKPLGVRRRDGA
ncbi:hypothetical protein MNBD_PLANCTO03-549 [hydrothermal vent metagenome]|uniref:Uncharacterized protein n=1 Tax=hydrothermal vent metagenome TaxID=652676 RepID=A0A3B1DHN6_9ZZZZ